MISTYFTLRLKMVCLQRKTMGKANSRVNCLQRRGKAERNCLKPFLNDEVINNENRFFRVDFFLCFWSLYIFNLHLKQPLYSDGFYILTISYYYQAYVITNFFPSQRRQIYIAKLLDIILLTKMIITIYLNFKNG